MRINVQQKSQRGSVTLKDLFTRSEYLKPTLIMFVIMICRQMTGVNYVTFYLNDIFIKADTGFSTELQSTIVSAVAVSKKMNMCSFLSLTSYSPQTTAVGVALVLVERFGRKILLFTSSTICSTSMILLGIYFYLEENMCVEGDEFCSSGMRSTLLCKSISLDLLWPNFYTDTNS